MPLNKYKIKVLSGYRITIPKEIREKLKIKVGDRLLISVQDDKIILKPVREHEALVKLANIADKYLGGPKKSMR